MNRFEDQITRIEIHFSDQKSSKNGQNDKKYMLEARLKSMNPISVTHHGNSHEETIKGEVDKLKTSLNTITGRLNNH